MMNRLAEICLLFMMSSHVVIAIDVCATGFFDNSTIDGSVDCQPCPEHCTSCITADNCAECQSGYYGRDCRIKCENCQGQCHKEIGHCTLGCPDGQFPVRDSPSECLNCSNNCRLCSSLSDCIQCKDGFFDKMCRKCSDLCFDNVCYQTGECLYCKTGYYKSNGGCVECSKGCKKCSHLNDCTDCHDQYIGPFKGTCLEKCAPEPSKTYFTSREQSRCVQLECGNKCTKKGYCVNSKDLSDGDICDLLRYQECNQTCKVCEHQNAIGLVCNGGYNCTEDCKSKYVSATLMDSCVQDNVLVDYAIENEGTTSILCDSEPSAMDVLMCVTSQYRSNGSCHNCPEHCTACNLTDDCTECKHGYYGPTCDLKCKPQCQGQCHKIYGHCTLGCPDGHFPVPESHCSKCNPNCKLCSSLSHCMQCKDSFFGKTCEQCSNLCVENTCDQNDGECKSCKVGYYKSNKACLQCAEGCKKCSHVNACSECHDGYLGPYYGTCIEQCPSQPDMTYFTSREQSRCVQLRCAGTCSKKGYCINNVSQSLDINVQGMCASLTYQECSQKCTQCGHVNVGGLVCNGGFNCTDSCRLAHTQMTTCHQGDDASIKTNVGTMTKVLCAVESPVSTTQGLWKWLIAVILFLVIAAVFWFVGQNYWPHCKKNEPTASKLTNNSTNAETLITNNDIGEESENRATNVVDETNSLIPGSSGETTRTLQDINTRKDNELGDEKREGWSHHMPTFTFKGQDMSATVRCLKKKNRKMHNSLNKTAKHDNKNLTSHNGAVESSKKRKLSPTADCHSDIRPRDEGREISVRDHSNRSNNTTKGPISVSKSSQPISEDSNN